MKTQIVKSFNCLIVASALCLGASVAIAQVQTNQVPNLLDTSAPAGFTLGGLFSDGVGAGLKHGALDLVYFVENTTNNGVISVEAGALYATSSKKVGGFADVYLPIGGTNSIFGAGFGIAYLDQNFYDATLNARIGDTFTLPWIHIPVYAYAESGGGYNLSRGEVIAQAFTGALFKIPVTANVLVTIGGAVGTISDEPGNIIALGGSCTWKF